MRNYLFKFLLAALTAIAVHFGIIFYLHGPIKAEYWARPLIIVKRELVVQIPSPKIVFFGGSSTLFDIDAAKISTELGRPTFNFGLHAGLRLKRILSEAYTTMKSGDLVVLPLEPPHYSCGREQWTDWQLDNALAWDHAYFDSLPFLYRVKIVLDSGSPSLSLEIPGAWLRAKLNPSKMKDRLAAMVPPKEIMELYRSGKLRTAGFSYSAYNLDVYGTLQNNIGAHFSGQGIATDKPGAICQNTKKILRTFVENMRQRGVTVVFAYPPYLVEQNENGDWRKADRQFRQDISDIGSTVVGNRSGAFYPRNMFFNTELHLNTKGRELFTRRMIDDLKSYTALPPSTDPHH